MQRWHLGERVEWYWGKMVQTHIRLPKSGAYIQNC
jgi:hypothetical protein